MRLLLDTHIFLWWASESSRLSPRVYALIRDSANTLLLSVASVWEIQIKLQLNKLQLDSPLQQFIASQQQTNNITILPIRACPQTLHAQKVLFPNQQGHNRWFPGYREDAHTAIVPSRAFGDCARASSARRATAGGRRIASFLATTDLVVNQKVRWKGRGFVDMLLG